MFEKGDILEATYRELIKGKHYIVYYKGFSQDDFIGGMITHSDVNGNFKMDANHFEIHNANGHLYKVTYDNSYLVQAKLIKPRDWGPFMKVGELSLAGIIFFENSIGELQSETFANYYRKQMNK
ncbi:hypothetical protein [Flavobacterium sp. PL02]|uniref:hypothetical protein n=1 Tax=Flavobacterium sp. PL02 TaxID=3088354 RepID=UPI002B2258AB|nr:hypothetical protein [Flavobacterium sp. PL02]MEA9414301.1 hypothetical protein [Flavobacterium sp. PL02]